MVERVLSLVHIAGHVHASHSLCPAVAAEIPAEIRGACFRLDEAPASERSFRLSQ